MQITLYIYSQQLPATDMTLYRCMKCGRALFKVNSSQIMISNAYGSSYESLPPFTHFMEYQCHFCKSLYNVLYQ